VKKGLCFSAMIAALLIAVPIAQAKPTIHQLKQSVNWQRSQAWYWQDLALVNRTHSNNSERSTHSRPYLSWLSDHWDAVRLRAKIHAQNPPHYSQWICIHGYEGAWNDPNAPYYGGLQMDLSFQRAHGWDALQRWGTADHWHPLTQMWVAERAWQTRGFYPWPNTARYCHLI
jgi:hypothetical protein